MQAITKAWDYAARLVINRALGRRVCRICGCWERDACVTYEGEDAQRTLRPCAWAGTTCAPHARSTRDGALSSHDWDRLVHEEYRQAAQADDECGQCCGRGEVCLGRLQLGGLPLLRRVRGDGPTNRLRRMKTAAPITTADPQPRDPRWRAHLHRASPGRRRRAHRRAWAPWPKGGDAGGGGRTGLQQADAMDAWPGPRSRPTPTT
jgi:hypothetical protein